MADSGIDLENPSPLHVFVGLLTSLTTTFFCIAINYKQMIWAELGFGLARTENLLDTSVHQLSWGWKFQFRFINIPLPTKTIELHKHINDSVDIFKIHSLSHLSGFKQILRCCAAVQKSQHQGYALPTHSQNYRCHCFHVKENLRFN